MAELSAVYDDVHDRIWEIEKVKFRRKWNKKLKGWKITITDRNNNEVIREVRYVLHGENIRDY